MGMQGSKYLVAGYPFEGNGNDIKGVNNGTVQGATFVDGLFGKAASFDGVDDYIDLGTTVYCPTNAAWSVSLWFKIPSGTIPTYGGLFSLKSNAGAGDFLLFYQPGFQYYLSCGYGTGRAGKSINYILDRDKWYHCCIVYNGSNYAMYLNTILQTLYSVPYGSFNTNNFIGKYLNTPSKSQIDNLKIYNKALTQSEIQRDYLNLPIF